MCQQDFSICSLANTFCIDNIFLYEKICTDQIINARRSMKHAEVVIARRAVEEGRGLVVIVNKMDLLRGKHKSSSYEKVMEVVPQEIQTIIPQVCHVIISLDVQ